jgi:hypothetical protein
MSTPADPLTRAPATGIEDAMLGPVTLATIALVLGLLAAGQSLPLHWLPGQVALLALLLCGLSAGTVAMQYRVTGVVGVEAAAYAGRARLAGLAATALLAVAVPGYEVQHLRSGQSSSGFPLTVALALGLCVLATSMAASLTRCWIGLYAQPWERRTIQQTTWQAQERETAGRVDRNALVVELWRWWLFGSVALAGTWALSARWPARDAGWAIPVVAGAFVLSFILGLVLLSEAARLRQSVHWDLEGIAVAPTLRRRWGRLSLSAAVAAIAAITLLWLLHVLDLLYAAETWIIQDVIVPLAHWLSRWFGAAQAPRACGSSCPIPKIPRGAPPRLAAASGTTRGTSISIDWSWLAHNWPLLIALATVVILGRSAWLARSKQGGAGFWRRILAVLAHDALWLLHLLRRPLRRLLTGAGTQLSRRVAAVAARGARRAGRRTPEGPRQVIIALYLLSLRHAAHRGYPRRPGQTPDEYAAAVSMQVPAAGETLQELTGLFVEVRYSRQPAGDERAQRMRALWHTALSAVYCFYVLIQPSRLRREGCINT